MSSLVPTLELKLQKTNCQKLDNTSTNTNTNNLVINNFIGTDEVPSCFSPHSRRSESFDRKPPLRTPSRTTTPRFGSPVQEREIPDVQKSPSTVAIEKFKDLLIEYQTELLLNDLDLIKNIAERGKNIIMKEQQLINIIKCLEPEANIVEIEKEEVEINCIKCSCKNPMYYKITDIIVDKTKSFKNCNVRVILEKQYNISLQYCI
jgi:hypothetical protein